jgi:prolyl 4-hydroxylase
VTLDAEASPDAVAVAKVQADARAGVAEASRLLASLAGAGVGVPQSWSVALEHLAEAARRGSASARGQLEALGSIENEIVEDHWGALAASVRIADWMAPCEKRVLNVAPRVVAIAGFLPIPAGNWLIGLAKGRTEPARVYAPDGGAAIEDDARSNSAFEFGWLNCDVVVLLTRARIAATIGVPVGALENSQVLHYATGQRFTRHVDYLDPTLPDVAERGQRIVTFLIYLNGDFDGGETDFPRLGVRYKGGPGDALYFANLDPAGPPDPRTLHAGLPPTRGEKWLFSQWVRNRARV